MSIAQLPEIPSQPDPEEERNRQKLLLENRERAILAELSAIRSSLNRLNWVDKT